MKISVIIPTYKPQQWIEECLESINSQTFDKREYEVIIVLNGCNEPYNTLIHRMLRKMKGVNIQFIQTDIPSVSNARNLGLDCAKGDYIAFIDDDDYVSPEYLQELYDIAVTGVTPVSNVVAFNDVTREVVNNYISDCYHRNKGGNCIPIMQVRPFLSVPVAKILLATRTIGSRRFNTHIKNGEDSLFMLTISDKIKVVTPSSENAIYYRRVRENSAATRKRLITEKVICKFRLLKGYCVCLLQPWRYNPCFVLSRIVACLMYW